MLTLKDVFLISSRFAVNLLLFASLSLLALFAAVPDANRPAMVAASLAAALLVAMYDSGVFSVDLETDEIY